MAEVFKARMTGVEGFQKIVAIKRILPHLTENDEFVTMFIDEAKLAAQLQHPNIIHIYDLGKIERSYYIAMEYIDGRDLRIHPARCSTRRKQRLPLGLALYIASRLAAALDYAHRKRDFQGREMALVHRDVSPQNVLISFDGDIKLCDFGIAKAASKASHTRAGALKGKLQYMSPEQAWGKDLDHRSDIFSLGLVLYEMLTGRKAFAGDSELSILEQVRSPTLATPRGSTPAVPPEVERIILQALNDNRERALPDRRGARVGPRRVLRSRPPDAVPPPSWACTSPSLLGRDRSGAVAAIERAGAATQARRGPPRARPRVRLAARRAPAPAAPARGACRAHAAIPEVSQARDARKSPCPWAALAAAAVLVLAVVVGVVLMTRERPAGPAAGEPTATPAPETVEMARQIAQQEVDRREGEMRERLTREILTATPAPAAAPRATAPPPQATAVPAAVAAPTAVPGCGRARAAARRDRAAATGGRADGDPDRAAAAGTTSRRSRGSRTAERAARRPRRCARHRRRRDSSRRRRRIPRWPAAAGQRRRHPARADRRERHGAGGPGASRHQARSRARHGGDRRRARVAIQAGHQGWRAGKGLEDHDYSIPTLSEEAAWQC